MPRAAASGDDGDDAIPCPRLPNLNNNLEYQLVSYICLKSIKNKHAAAAGKQQTNLMPFIKQCASFQGVFCYRY